MNTNSRVTCEICENLAPRWATTTFVVKAEDGTERFLCHRCVRKLRRLFPQMIQQVVERVDPKQIRIVEI